MGILVKEAAGETQRGEETGCDGLLWVSMKNGSVETIVVVIYLVPVNSKTARAGHNEKVEMKFKALMAAWSGKRVVVLGDINARVSEIASVAYGPVVDEDFEVVEETTYERENMDKKANKRGEEMMEMMNAANVVILNGVKSEPMEFTFVGPMGWSGIDVIGATPSLIKDIDKWGVKAIEGSELEVGSDHRMIVGPWVQAGLTLAQKANNGGRAKEREKKAKWRRKTASRPNLWDEMRQEGEEQMEEFIREWTRDMKMATAPGQ